MTQFENLHHSVNMWLLAINLFSYGDVIANEDSKVPSAKNTDYRAIDGSLF